MSIDEDEMLEAEEMPEPALARVRRDIVGCRNQHEAAAIYRGLLRTHRLRGPRFWKQVNGFITSRWPRGLVRVKTMAWKGLETEGTIVPLRMPRQAEFKVVGLPRAKGNLSAFQVGKRVVVTERNTGGVKQWQQLVRLAAQPQAWKPLAEGAVELDICFTFVTPRSLIRKTKPPKRDKPWVKPDLGKLARTVEDALTGIFYRDDAQVCEERLRKEYGDWSGVRVVVLEEADSRPCQI